MNKPTIKLKVQKNSDGTESASVSARFDIDWIERIVAVAEASRRTNGAIIKMCVEDHLPIMERELGIKPGQPAKKKVVV